MVALLSLCSLFALGAVAEEVITSARRAAALRRARRSCAWHAYRPEPRPVILRARMR